MSATWTKLDQTLNQIEDPEAGLALLAKRPEGATPEQVLDLLFWHIQFTDWRDWLGGNRLAVAHAQMLCTLSKKPPPPWLSKAVHMLCMSDVDQRACDDMRRHVLRWQAVELVCGRLPGDPRNREKKGRGWLKEATELVAHTDANADSYTVRKSHALINRAVIKRPHGIEITLQSYRGALEERDRRRKKRRKGGISSANR
jgi:hypothetical protein